MITLRIISPEGERLSAEVELVELPGMLGRFEVLKDHAPLIS
jgi:F-type H+-transporting ATPase subunit epsilon